MIDPFDVDVLNIALDVNVVNMVVRSNYHHGDLKRALTEAALALVGEKGPRGFTLTEAARRAGVSSAAPYRHFADREALLASVAEQGFRDLSAAIQTDTAAETSDSAADPVEAMIAMGRAYVQWAVTHPDHYRVMFGTELDKLRHPELKAAGDLAFGGLLTALAAAQQAGVLPGDDPRPMAGPMWALVHGVASLAVGNDLRQVGLDEDPAELAARAAGAWLTAIRQDR